MDGYSLVGHGMNHTSIRDLQSWIEELAKAAATKRFQAPNFLKPFHFVTLANLLQTIGAQGVRLPEHLQAFATRMHLWQALGLESPAQVTERDHTGRFLPLRALWDEESVHAQAIELSTILGHQCFADEDTISSVHVVLSEILANCFAHAAVVANCCGMACAQTWPKGNLVQFAFSDPGIGIRASLSENPSLRPRLESENACALATELHVTSKPGRGHDGYGLTLAKQLMAGSGGNFLLISGTEAFRATGTREIRRELPTGWQGTIVVLEWSM